MSKRRHRHPPTEGVDPSAADEKRPPSEEPGARPSPEEDPAAPPGESGAPLDEPAPLEALEGRVRELEDRLLRAQAEFRNETQRIARQAEENRKWAVEGVVRDLLVVFDALHSARQGLGGEGAPPPASLGAVRQGFDLVERQLLDVLRRHGVERIEAEKASFDPARHEALFVVDHPDLPPNTVAQVLRPGFLLNGRVIRAAHVAVTRQATDEGSANPAGAGPPEE